MMEHTCVDFPDGEYVGWRSPLLSLGLLSSWIGVLCVHTLNFFYTELTFTAGNDLNDPNSAS